MRWRLWLPEDYARLRNGWELPAVSESGPLIALVHGGEPFRLAGPPAASDGLPVLELELLDLRRAETWRDILRYYPLYRGDLARWQHRHPEVSPETLLEALGVSATFKTVSEWREWSELDELSVGLGRQHDLPLPVLRLWNRLGEELRRGWLAVWDLRNFKRNLIRDIILDFYELAPDARAATLAEARRFAETWNQRSAAFPQDEVRDLVRARRAPAIAELRREIYKIKRELGLRRGVQLDSAEDLEDARLTLRIEFESVAQLDELLRACQDEKFRAGLERIIGLLR